MLSPMKAILIALLATLLSGCTSQDDLELSSFDEGQTVSIQCANTWKNAGGMRAYYYETVDTFSRGGEIDIDAHEARSFDIFRKFARESGLNESEIVDNWKLIPRQMVDIAKADPAVLKDYDSFWAAIAGPE